MFVCVIFQAHYYRFMLQNIFEGNQTKMTFTDKFSHFGLFVHLFL